MTSDNTTPDAVPSGWAANPSAWRQRLPVVALAMVGFAIASYLAAYQYGLVGDVWEPFFGAGSRTVLKSPHSVRRPISWTPSAV